MNILITGGLGFQGLHLVQALAPDHIVTILNTPSSAATRNLLHLSEQPLAFRLVWGSVTDPEIVSKVVEGQDVILHLAAFTSVNESFRQPLAALGVNVQGTYRILDTVHRLASRAHVIIASTCEVYGSAVAETQSEYAPLTPHSPYAASKAAADRLAFAYAMTYGVRVTIVRPCNIYGPHQKDGHNGAVIPIMVRAALSSRAVVVTGDGRQRREFMHVDDLVRAYLALVQHGCPSPGAVFNFGSGQRIEIRAIAEYIAGVFQADIVHAPDRPAEVWDFMLDTFKAKSLLSVYPQIDFWDGLDRYIVWRRAQEPA